MASWFWASYGVLVLVIEPRFLGLLSTYSVIELDSQPQTLRFFLLALVGSFCFSQWYLNCLYFYLRLRVATIEKTPRVYS